MHDATKASGILLVWLVSDADPAYPGKFAARAYIADIAGSVFQDGALVAATLDKLRAQMPVGLTVRLRRSIGRRSSRPGSERSPARITFRNGLCAWWGGTDAQA
jgi:hypothetical protein